MVKEYEDWRSRPIADNFVGQLLLEFEDDERLVGTAFVVRVANDEQSRRLIDKIKGKEELYFGEEQDVRHDDGDKPNSRKL